MHDGRGHRAVRARTQDDGGHGDMAKRNPKHEHLVEPTWGQSDDGGATVTEILAESAGPLSPFGEDHDVPHPPNRLR